ncbi:hypothetical protein TWF718_010368 [Orbilia javanica]|uniref:F-box domain-containing protein n=1 Tax=Orbilia javanica TaxID=47235 RepID=A0AAN8MLV5_9PEZI
MSNPPSPPPPPQSKFLSLPRELRDQIYSYLLTTPLRRIPNPGHPPGHRASEVYIPYRVRCRNLGLFRVSRQIHDEASEAFYKRNVWPIRIVIARECAQSPDCLYRLHATYEAPWEEVAYGMRADGKVGKFYDVERFYRRARVGRFEPHRIIVGLSTDSYPATKYRSLLRKVRVEVIDFRFHRAVGEPSTRSFDLAGRSILLPFMGRLKSLLGPAGKNVTLTVKLLSDWVPGPTRSKGSSNDVISLETLWPLTRGEWKCYIRTEFDDDVKGREFRARVLSRCGRDSWLGEDKMLKFGGATVTGDCYFATVGGRLRLVANGSRYNCCYWCDRREFDQRRLRLMFNS